MAKKKKASRNGAPRKKRVRQKMIPGTEPVTIKEIDRAIETYVLARDERMAALEEEVDAKTKLMELMKKHKLDTYDYEDRRVLIKADENLSVKKVKKEELATA